nr:unnamed protein product [Digitaria exilis]
MAAKHPRDLANVAIDLAQRAVTDTDAKVDSVLRSGAAGNHNDNLHNDNHPRVPRHDRQQQARQLEEEVRETVRRVLLVAAMQKRCSAS